MKKFLLVIPAMFVFQFSFADILTLMNGHVFEGSVQKIKGCSVVFKCEKEKYTIPADSIYSIEFVDVNDPVYKEYMSLSESDACLKGTLDAEQFHGKAGSHIVLGFLFGPFAIIGAALASPNPYKGRNTLMMSKNRDSFSDPVYLQCYKKKAKARNVGNTAVGWGIWIAIVLITST